VIYKLQEFNMKIAVGSDHRGHGAKEKIMVLLGELGHDVQDMGTHSKKSCDYPDAAYAAALSVSKGESDCGILICGSGIGVSICANKVKGIRAALCHDELTAELSKRHNQANILCLASDVLGDEIMRRIVTCWLNTEAENSARHVRRIEKIYMIEKGVDPREYQVEE